MADPTSRIALRFSDDARIRKALGCVVANFSERIGFKPAEREDLLAAAEAACQNTFQLVSEDGAMIGVTIENFPDRLELTFEHRGEPAPSLGLDELVGAPPLAEGGLSGAEIFLRVDRVQYATEGDLTRMTLVKNVRNEKVRS